MKFIVKSRWGMFVEPTYAAARKAADEVNQKDKNWGLPATAVVRRAAETC